MFLPHFFTLTKFWLYIKNCVKKYANLRKSERPPSPAVNQESYMHFTDLYQKSVAFMALSPLKVPHNAVGRFVEDPPCFSTSVFGTTQVLTSARHSSVWTYNDEHRVSANGSLSALKYKGKDEPTAGPLRTAVIKKREQAGHVPCCVSWNRHVFRRAGFWLTEQGEYLPVRVYTLRGKRSLAVEWRCYFSVFS